MAELFGKLGELKDKNFIAGTDELRQMNVKFKTAVGALKAGTIVAKDTDGSYKAATDNTASAVLAVDIDATAADVVAPVYIKGAFIAEKCTGYDESTMLGPLRALNIYMVHEH